MAKAKKNNGHRKSATRGSTSRKKIAKKEKKVIVHCHMMSATGGSTRRNTGRKQIAEVEEKVAVPCLNNDVMTNILTRIPADLLHKGFRFQCSEWFNMFSHPDFKDANLFTSKPGILFVEDDINNNKVMGFMEYDGLETKTRELFTFTPKLQVMSSCNGLVLVARYPSDIFILNPSTEESIEIPQCEHESLWHDLVFVPSTKEYKVVDMFYDESHGWCLAFHVRSLGRRCDDAYCFTSLSDIWIPSSYGSMFGHIYWNQRTFVDGILYVNIGSMRKTISFDVCNGSVQLLNFPDFGEVRLSELNEADELDVAIRLIDLGGFLGVIDCVKEKEHDPCHFDVWILKDRVVGEWEKKFRIDIFDKLLVEVYYELNGVVGSLKDGEEIIFAEDNKIFVYNVKSRQWKLTTLEANKIGSGNAFKCCCVHVNSLMSLKQVSDTL